MGKSQCESNDGALSPTLPWSDRQGGDGSASSGGGAKLPHDPTCCVCNNSPTHRCAFAACDQRSCFQCATVVECDYGDICVCTKCTPMLAATEPIELPLVPSCALAQQTMVTLPVLISGRWAWVRTGQHEDVSKVVDMIMQRFGLVGGTWRVQGPLWEDNDVLEYYGVKKLRRSDMVWRAVRIPSHDFTTKLYVEVSDNVQCPFFVPSSISWAQLQRRVVCHLAVAPEWVEVSMREACLRVQPTEAFPCMTRETASQLWRCIDGLRLRSIRRADLGNVAAVVTGLRATRARGLTVQSMMQSAAVSLVNDKITRMLPSARYSAFAVINHRSVPVHCDMMDRPGALSYMFAAHQCHLWISDVCGDHDIVYCRQACKGRAHDAGTRWCSFDPRQPHAVLSDETVKTIVLYTPRRLPSDAQRDQLRQLGFPLAVKSGSGNPDVFRDLWGGGSRRRGPSRGKAEAKQDEGEQQQTPTEYTRALVLLRTCRMGLSDPQLKFILRGTQGLAERVLSCNEPARVTQMVHAIAANLGMNVPKPAVGAQSRSLGAKPKQQSKPEGEKGAWNGSSQRQNSRAQSADPKPKQKNGAKDSFKRVLCDDEWSVPVGKGDEFTVRASAVYMTQSVVQAKKWSDVAHSASTCIGIVMPCPMQIGYREPTLVQFHLRDEDDQRTPAKGYLHHVTVGAVKCRAEAQLIELPSLKIRSMLVMIDVCKERVAPDAWVAVTLSYQRKHAVGSLRSCALLSGARRVPRFLSG
eukprot:6131026-Amphidinium_carterae.3